MLFNIGSNLIVFLELQGSLSIYRHQTWSSPEHHWVLLCRTPSTTGDSLAFPVLQALEASQLVVVYLTADPVGVSWDY